MKTADLVIAVNTVWVVVAAIADAAHSGHESGDGLVWTSRIENVTHNRSGLPLGEVEVA